MVGTASTSWACCTRHAVQGAPLRVGVLQLGGRRNGCSESDDAACQLHAVVGGTRSKMVYAAAFNAEAVPNMHIESLFEQTAHHLMAAC